jgi:hypothetical protein
LFDVIAEQGRTGNRSLKGIAFSEGLILFLGIRRTLLR